MLKLRFLKLLGAVAVINIIARLFGFAREVIIGYQYGTTYQSDSIITAITIPNFLYLVVGGAVTTAFISVYSKLGGTRRDLFARTIFTALSMIIGIVTVLFMVFPAFWMELFFSGMSEEAMQLTSSLFRWTAPATLFLVVGIALSGLHNVYGNYRLSTFSTFLFNGVYLVIGVGLTPWLMEYSYALGASLGAACMFMFLVFFIHRRQLMALKFKVTKMPEIDRFIKLSIPLILGGATMQFYLIIQRVFASNLHDGLIASLNYASKMTQFPQAVLMASVTTIIYPMLAKAAGDGDTAKMKQAYQQGFRMLAIILLPASIFIFFYAEEIIMFIFQYGNFNSDSTNATYPLLQIFSLSIFGLALNTYITRFFYAVEKTILPVVVNVFAVFGVNILVIVLYIDQLGARAIALGTVISAIVNMLLLIVFARVSLDLVISTIGLLGKIATLTVIGVGVIWLVASIPFNSLLLSLVCGGMATLAMIGSGLKLVK